MVRFVAVMGSLVVLAVSLACGGANSSPVITNSSVCPALAVTVDSWPEGTRLTLIGLHPDDAYADRISGPPISGVTIGEMTMNGDCWMGGPFDADDGTGYYFFKAAFTQ